MTKTTETGILGVLLTRGRCLQGVLSPSRVKVLCNSFWNFEEEVRDSEVRGEGSPMGHGADYSEGRDRSSGTDGRTRPN